MALKHSCARGSFVVGLRSAHDVPGLSGTRLRGRGGRPGDVDGVARPCAAPVRGFCPGDGGEMGKGTALAARQGRRGPALTSAPDLVPKPEADDKTHFHGARGGRGGSIRRPRRARAARRGVNVRGLTRDPRQAEAVRRRGAAEVAIGDLRDPASLDAALEGVDAVFYIAPAFMSDEAEAGQRLVAAAKRAGVRRLVFSSAIYPISARWSTMPPRLRWRRRS